MPRRYWRYILAASVFLGAALGNWNDTTTGIDLQKLHQFPLFRIRSGWLKSGSRVAFDGITAIATDDPREVRLRGTGKSGKRWEAHMCCLDEVWRGDLDGNGTQDYIFFSSGPYFNGRTTPLFSLTILLMDRQGLPVPFFTVVYHGENGDGIKHVVDLERDGRAELLISSYDEAVSDARVGPFCSGHWTTQLYRFKNLGVEEFRATVGGLRFPFVQDWTYRGGECAEEEKPFLAVEPPTFFEHGTSSVGEVTTSIREADENGRLTIDPVAGCQTVQPAMIVYDRTKVREIGFPNMFSSYKADIADAIRRDGVRVELRGVDKWMGHGDCSANLMWAGQ